jgi:hypothetical protein
MDNFDESNKYEVDLVCKILNAKKRSISKIDGKILFEIPSFEICYLFSHLFSFVYIREIFDYDYDKDEDYKSSVWIKIESYNKKEFHKFFREQKLKRILNNI